MTSGIGGSLLSSFGDGPKPIIGTHRAVVVESWRQELESSDIVKIILRRVASASEILMSPNFLDDGNRYLHHLSAILALGDASATTGRAGAFISRSQPHILPSSCPGCV